VSPDELLERARAVLSATAGTTAKEGGKDGGNGARRRPRTAEGLGVPAPDAGQEFTQGGRTPRGGPHLGRPAVGLKPLKASPIVTSPNKVSVVARPAGDANALLAKLSDGIDDLFEADLSSALAQAPRTITAPEGDREFDDMPTDDRRQRPSLADRRTALLRRWALVEEGDYFEVLGLSRDASADEVKRAYDRIALELAPDAIDPVLSGELGVKLDAIREVVGEAARVLGDANLRPRYQNNLA
jgi:hypothetical protein